MGHRLIWAAIFFIVAAHTAVAAERKPLTQDYVREPMPPGFQVVVSELEGPVFADAAGHTLYNWPIAGLRNGSPGEPQGTPHCYDVHYRATAGVTSPYPEGRELPEADTRPTCIQHWPPVYAAPDAKPVGNWSILDRTDGTKQWAYKRMALYTSHLDHQPGETNGGTAREGWAGLSAGAQRKPLRPAPALPTQFAVAQMALGQMLTTATNYFSIYAYDKDTSTKSNCTGDCLKDWVPILAPEAASPRGEWSVIQRVGGARQWTYRGMPLYTHILDPKPRSYEGSDVPGWHNVFMQRGPGLPKGFRVTDTQAGQVIADRNGKTVYFYSCSEDTQDTLFCDTPDSPQVYRWAVCGGGDPKRCLETFPYVIADKDAKSDSMAWSVRDIDPKSGQYVAAGTSGSLHIWAYRGRPIYTFVGDRDVGDIEADGWGQDQGARNGFKAFWLRDDFRDNDGPFDSAPA